MTSFPKWSEVRADMVAAAGGEEAVPEARKRNQSYTDGHRLAERRKALGMSQTDVADTMGVTKSRVSQIERGEVSTIDAIARYVQALGGEIQISAVFGDDQYILRGTHAARPGRPPTPAPALRRCEVGLTARPGSRAPQRSTRMREDEGDEPRGGQTVSEQGAA